MTADTPAGGGRSPTAAEPLRATCDANVLVSALLTPDGEASAVLRASRASRFILVSSKSILDEMVDVMMRPQLRRYHDLSLRDLAGARAELEHHAKMVPGKYVDLDMVPTDPRRTPTRAPARGREEPGTGRGRGTSTRHRRRADPVHDTQS